MLRFSAEVKQLVLERRAMLVIVALSVVAIAIAACGGGGESSDDPTPGPQSGTPSPTDRGGIELTATINDGWSAVPITEGIKPTVALGPDGTPAIAYLFESISEGFVGYASASEGWAAENFVEGYFYGPLDVAIDAAGEPNIVYHDHQADQFDQSKGDLTFAVRSGGEWEIEALADDGHDGWDSALVLGEGGRRHAFGIDPSQFGSDDGVEYYAYSDGAWTVSAIGSGPIAYEFNVSPALGPDGNPAVSYFNDVDGDLIYAEFDGGTWSLDIVASEGIAGKFSSLQIDAEGTPHIAFYNQTSQLAGTVQYATRVAREWQIEDIATLDDVELGMLGARRITSLALGSDGEPRVAFSDRSSLSYAVRDAGGWTVEEIVSAGSLPLGQLVSLKIDSGGAAHIAYYEVTGRAPLSGVIGYVTKS
jgi:hypothetical protein